VWLIILSDQLPIIALVGRYPTNQLIGRSLLHRRFAPFLGIPTRIPSAYGITPRFRGLPPAGGQIGHVFLTRPPRECPEGHPVRLACIRHAASVDPEPGSNSPPSPSAPDVRATVARPAGVRLPPWSFRLRLAAVLWGQGQTLPLPGRPGIGFLAVHRTLPPCTASSSAHHRLPEPLAQGNPAPRPPGGPRSDPPCCQKVPPLCLQGDPCPVP
jgi:hypothetical protein